MKEKAKEILIRAKKDVFSGNIGDNITTFKGDGLDFQEIKDYNYGDDVRKINWNASAKSNGIKVNVFNEERELNIVLAFLVSGSLHFGSIAIKQEVVAEILALLGFSALYNHNILRTLFFSNKLEKFYEPTRDESMVYKLVEDALDINVIGKEVDYRAFVDFINGEVKRKALIFIVGDFYGDIDFSKIAYKNQLYAIIVRDRLEEYPLLNGEFELVNPINLSSGEFNITKAVAEKYKRLLKEQDRKLKEHFLKHQITYGKIYTDEDIYIKLSQIIKG